MEFLVSFLVSFLGVFLKVVQQKNVIHNNVKWMLPVSMLMGFSQTLIIMYTVQTSILIFIPVGLGGEIAAILAVKFHDKFNKK